MILAYTERCRRIRYRLHAADLRAFLFVILVYFQIPLRIGAHKTGRHQPFKCLLVYVQYALVNTHIRIEVEALAIKM